MGKWLAENSEAVYGTTGGIFPPDKWGASTRKGKNLYLLVQDWSQFPKYLPQLPFKINSIKVHNHSINFKTDENGTEFYIPEWMRDQYVTVIKISTNQDLTDIQL